MLQTQAVKVELRTDINRVFGSTESVRAVANRARTDTRPSVSPHFNPQTKHLNSPQLRGMLRPLRRLSTLSVLPSASAPLNSSGSRTFLTLPRLPTTLDSWRTEAKSFRNFRRKRPDDSNPEESSEHEKPEEKKANRDEKPAAEEKETESNESPFPKFNFGGGSGGPEMKYNPMFGIAAMASIMVIIEVYRLLTDKRELSFKEFVATYLEPGLVSKLIVVDRSQVSVVLKSGSPTSTPASTPSLNSPPSTSSYDNTAEDDNRTTVEVYTSKVPESGQSRRFAHQDRSLYFQIGSVESFERNLEQAQLDLGIPRSQFLPVIYENSQVSGWLEILSTVLTVGATIWIVRKFAQGMPGARANNIQKNPGLQFLV